MKNREKYRDEILNSVFEGNVEAYCEFAKKNVLPNLTDCTKGECDEVSSCTLCRTMFSFWLDEEYEEPPKPEVDWNKVPVDTLVRVRDNESGKWILRYFKGFSRTYSSYPPGYDYEVWGGGTTSVTAEECTERWRYCELVEDEENGN